MRKNMLLLCLATAQAQAQPADTLQGLPWGVVTFVDARALGVDPAGRVYVVDPGAAALVVLEASGALQRVFTGNADSPLREPVDVDPTNGLLVLVADAGAGKVYRLGKEGLLLEALGGEQAPRLGSFDLPEENAPFVPAALASNRRGDVFVADARARRLIWWDGARQRRVLSSPDDGLLVAPRGLATTDEALYVLDGAAVLVFDFFGTPLRRFGTPAAAAALRVRRMGARIGLVGLQEIALYTPQGTLEHTLIWQGPPLRDAALAQDALYLLTAQALYRLPRAR